MDENILNKYLRDLKFIVLADAKTRTPFEIFFSFGLPNLHSEIFAEAKKQHAIDGKEVCVQGGGRITKKDNFIIFHGTSEKYKRYENDIVLSLAANHPIIKSFNFIILSKAGEDNVDRIIEDYNEKQIK